MDHYYICRLPSGMLYVFVVKTKFVSRFAVRMADYLKLFLVLNEKRRTSKGYICVDFDVLTNMSFRILYIDSEESLLSSTINFATTAFKYSDSEDQIKLWSDRIVSWVGSLRDLLK